MYNCDRLSIAFDQVQHVQIDDGSSQGEEDAQEGAAHKLWKTCVSFVTVFVWSGAWGFGVCMWVCGCGRRVPVLLLNFRLHCIRMCVPTGAGHFEMYHLNVWIHPVCNSINLSRNYCTKKKASASFTQRHWSECFCQQWFVPAAKIPVRNLVEGMLFDRLCAVWSCCNTSVDATDLDKI